MSNDDHYMGRFSEGAEVLGEDDPEKHRSGSFADEDLGATDTSADTRTTAIADLAYARFCRGFTEGRWDESFDLVADEVDFAWPTAPGAGRFTGADGRRKMEERFRAFGGDGLLRGRQPWRDGRRALPRPSLDSAPSSNPRAEHATRRRAAEASGFRIAVGPINRLTIG